MKWRVEHTVDAPVERVETAVLDPANIPLLAHYMPAIAEARVLSFRDEGDTVVAEWHFRPKIAPPKFAKGVTPEMVQWVQHLVWDRRTHAGTYEIRPNLPAEWQKYFAGTGTYRLEPRDGGRSARVIDGDFAIRVAVVGPIAERFALAMLREQFAGEAEMLRARV